MHILPEKSVIFNYLPEVDFNIIKNVKGLDLLCRTYNQNKEGLRPLKLEAICYLYDSSLFIDVILSYNTRFASNKRRYSIVFKIRFVVDKDWSNHNIEINLTGTFKTVRAWIYEYIVINAVLITPNHVYNCLQIEFITNQLLIT